MRTGTDLLISSLFAHSRHVVSSTGPVRLGNSNAAALAANIFRRRTNWELSDIQLVQTSHSIP